MTLDGNSHITEADYLFEYGLRFLRKFLVMNIFLGDSETIHYKYIYKTYIAFVYSDRVQIEHFHISETSLKAW